MSILLTIAIPTFNRANILDEAIKRILPEIKQFEEFIELIISDNFSEDNTWEVIQRNLSESKLKNAISFRQSQNTGYYGNFRKCRELSHGKYFWLLSDNDHLTNGVITKVVTSLIEELDVAVVYLHSNYNKPEFSTYSLDFNKITVEHNRYALMLISAVIVYNEKKFDEEIFNDFESNSFLGFFYFGSALSFSKKIIIIEGLVFNQFPTIVTFDIITAWTKDIMGCIDYLEKNSLINEVQKKDIVTGFLQRVVIHHVFNYIVKKKLFGRKYGSIPEIKARLENYYSGNKYFNDDIIPLFTKPRFIVVLSYYMSFLKRQYSKIFSFIKYLSNYKN